MREGVSRNWLVMYRHGGATLRQLIPKLFFSSPAAHPCLSLPEHDLDVPSLDRILSNCLYSGRHFDALSLLRRIPPSRYFVFYWNNIIQRQHQKNALHAFDEMRRLGWAPDGYTYPFVFKACGDLPSLVTGMSVHALALVSGLTDCNVFVNNAAIAMYGRCGAYDKAQQVFDEMLERGLFDTISWNSIISVHVQIGDCRRAFARRWKDVAKIRSLMKHSGIRKRPGCSWVQGKNGTATFYVGDKSHPMSEEISKLLDDLIDRIKIMGYVPETTFALHDVDDEEKGDLLLEHSEKLALAYGILTTSPGMPIRIIKNLRVCGDCHTAISYISRIIDHEVIVRDSSRFHHFKNGSCSCKGYW
ncbi:hypothetical protein ACS0TY_025347 [Phlomoides rotata]